MPAVKDFRRAADTLDMDTIGGSFPSIAPASGLSSGTAAITAGSRQIARDAQQIANPEAPNYTGALLDLSQSSQLAQAGADVVRASNQMLGTLLDAFA